MRPGKRNCVGERTVEGQDAKEGYLECACSRVVHDESRNTIFPSCTPSAAVGRI